ADIALHHGLGVRGAAVASEECSQSEELARRHNGGRDLLTLERQVIEADKALLQEVHPGSPVLEDRASRSARAHLELVRDLRYLGLGHSLEEVQAAEEPELVGHAN